MSSALAYRVCSNNRVLVLDGLTTRNTSTIKTCIDLFSARVNRSQPMQSFPEFGRQPLVRLCHVAKEGVPTSRRAIQGVQESCAGRLPLKGDI